MRAEMKIIWQITRIRTFASCKADPNLLDQSDDGLNYTGETAGSMRRKVRRRQCPKKGRLEWLKAVQNDTKTKEKAKHDS